MPSCPGAFLYSHFRMACFISSKVMACSSGRICVDERAGCITSIMLCILSLCTIIVPYFRLKWFAKVRTNPVGVWWTQPSSSCICCMVRCVRRFLLAECGILLGVHHQGGRFRVSNITVCRRALCSFTMFAFSRLSAVIFPRE